MDGGEGDSDSEILVIDHDEEPKEAGLLNNEQANKILANEEIELKKYYNKHRGVISASKPHDFNIHCSIKEDEKEKKGDDRRSSTQREYLEHKHVHKAKKRLTRGTSNSSDIASVHHSHDNSYLDFKTSPRVLYKSNRAHMDVNMLEIGDHVRRRIEDNQAEERRYTMDDYIRTLNTNTYRPWITHAYGHEAVPNIAYGIQEPDAYKSRINAYRPEAAINIEDTMIKNVYNHTLRTDHDINIDGYGYAKMNRNSYSHDRILEDPRCIDHRYAINRYAYGHGHKPDDPLSRYSHNHTYIPEHFINMDDCRHAIFNSNTMHDYRPEHILNIDDYRYATMYKNVFNSTHRPDVALAIDKFNPAIMSRHAYDVYRRQATLDPFRLQSEEAPFQGPSINGGDTGRLGSETLRNGNYPEVPSVFIRSPQVVQNNPPRSDRSGDVNIAREETALNLVMKKRQVSYNVGQENPEPIISYKKKYRIQTSIINQNKPNYEQSNTITDTTYTYKKNNRPEDSVQLNVYDPVISDRKYRPDTVILNTKCMYSTKTLNMPTQIDVPVHTNKTINVGDHNSGTDTLDSTVCTNAERCKVTRNNDVDLKENATVDETARKSNALAQEINELARSNNVKFLVVFFTRVKDLVKETFPEFAKSLQKEIETLGAVSVDGKVKTDIQYICPLYCSVSTYSFPRFDMTDDNKIEKHVNRVKICDVCSCIQNCYKLYKRKYYDLLTRHLVGNEREKEERTTSVIKSVGVCKNKPENMTRSGAETDANTRKDEGIYKESPTNLEHSYIEQGEFNHVSFSAHENIDTGDLSCKITDNMFKFNVEKTIFDELSTLTFNLPNNNIGNAIITPKIPSSSYKGREETSTNGSLNIINKIPPETFHQNLNVSKNDSNHKNSTHNRNPAKDEPNLIFSLSLDEINNADIIASKLKNKISRKPDSVFTCHICTCMFTYYTSFVSHLQKEHNINDIDEEIPDGCIARKCPFCGYYSKQKYHNDHVKRTHPEIFTHKGDIRKIKIQKVDKRKKSNKRKFVFICLVCNENLMSYEVNAHREAKHKGMNIPKMFTKKLLGNGAG